MHEQKVFKQTIILHNVFLNILQLICMLLKEIVLADPAHTCIGVARVGDLTCLSEILFAKMIIMKLL